MSEQRRLLVGRECGDSVKVIENKVAMVATALRYVDNINVEILLHTAHFAVLFSSSLVGGIVSSDYVPADGGKQNP